MAQQAEPHACPTVVIGLGATGLSCARWLARQGIPFAVTDSRAEPPGLGELRRELPDVPVALGGFSPALLAGAEELIVSPGIDVREPAIARARAAGAVVLGDIELFARQARAPVVAITGANGKSTVTTLLGDMAKHCGLAVRVGGNLGTPALALLADTEPDLYVLELSSFQLESTYSLRPRAAAVLNITPDHMDRYDSIQAYAAAKARVYHGCETWVVNRDDPWVVGMLARGVRVAGFRLGVPGTGDFGLSERDGEPWLAQGDTALLPVSAMRLRGLHNVANALAALALGSAAGLAMPPMLAVLRTFSGLPHRCQWVAERRGVSWYNDSKGTNVGATCAAIRGLGAAQRLVLIAGGDGKGADFAPLAEAAAGLVRAVVVLGRDGPRVAAALAPVTRVLAAADLVEAVRQAAALAQAGDAVLLSPACASLDMFRNYADRGEQFIAAVEALVLT
ncbi:MAG: UDP-N-acetylmuramoyl-L-alanine--D-glutamate ligase [Gammaproteobacteria bacterium]